jgi:hypothetical protein
MAARGRQAHPRTPAPVRVGEGHPRAREAPAGTGQRELRIGRRTSGELDDRGELAMVEALREHGNRRPRNLDHDRRRRRNLGARRRRQDGGKARHGGECRCKSHASAPRRKRADIVGRSARPRLSGRRRSRRARRPAAARSTIGDLAIPVVYAYVESGNPEDLSILSDDEQGGALAVNHLLRTGRTKVAHVTGPERHLSARLREAGARAALQGTCDDFAGGGTLWGKWSEAWGRDAAQILLRSGDPFDAVFCGSD